jgi:hypothetical protein
MWPLLLILCTGLLLALALKCGERFAPGTVPRSRTFWCPFVTQNVRVEFEETAWDGQRVEVCRCSAFTPSTAIACDKACLKLGTFPALHRTLAL